MTAPIDRRAFLGLASAATVAGLAPAAGAHQAVPANAAATMPTDRAPAADAVRGEWVRQLRRIADPVVTHLAGGRLRMAMPVEKSPTYATDSFPPDVVYVEAVGRTFAGIAPWLALPDNGDADAAQRSAMREQALQGLVHAFDPRSPDRLDFGAKWQPIVDAAYLAQAFLRAPDALWAPLDNKTRQRAIAAFQSLRDRKPWYNNWLLFGAMTETFLRSVDAAWDPMRVDYALNKLDDWYVGDGWHSDGPTFAFDYYNSFVIHPMLVDILAAHARLEPKAFEARHAQALKRMQRYGVGQERMISPEGTFPPVGRSITYRSGALQALAQLALMDMLPEGVSAAQVRGALTAVHRNFYDHPGTFNAAGWLQLGFVGHQPEIADYYTSTGSLYMATLSFLPLGLPSTHAFWTSPAQDWTAKRAWGGQVFPKDYHVDY